MTHVALLLLLAQPAPKTDPVRTLTKRYLEFNRLFVSLDAPGIKKWLQQNATPSFFNRTFDGSTLNANETAASMASEFAVLKSVHADVKLSNFSIHPDHASCSVTSHLTLILKTGAKFKMDSVAVDTWQLARGAWKITGIVTTAQKTTPVTK